MLLAEGATLFCSLEVTGHDLDPEFVSARLELMPDRAHRRGVRKLSSRLPTYQGMWAVYSSNHVTSDDLSAHVHFIAALLETRRMAVLGLRECGLSVRIRMFCELDDDVLSTSLDPQDLRIIGSLVDGVDLSVT